MHGYKCLHGGDLNENGNFKDGKLVLMVTTFCMRVILTKMAILAEGN